MSMSRLLVSALFVAGCLALPLSQAAACSDYDYGYNQGSGCSYGNYQGNPYDYQHDQFGQCFQGYHFGGYDCGDQPDCGDHSFNWNCGDKDVDCGDHTPQCGDWNDHGSWDCQHGGSYCDDHQYNCGHDCNWDRDHKCHAVPTPMAAWAGMSLLGGLSALRSLRRGRQEIDETF